jgi:hypothetical protein
MNSQTPSALRTRGTGLPMPAITRRDARAPYTAYGYGSQHTQCKGRMLLRRMRVLRRSARAVRCEGSVRGHQAPRRAACLLPSRPALPPAAPTAGGSARAALPPPARAPAAAAWEVLGGSAAALPPPARAPAAAPAWEVLGAAESAAASPMPMLQPHRVNMPMLQLLHSDLQVSKAAAASPMPILQTKCI